MYYIAIFMTIGANILYHISQKNISQKLNPMVSLTVTYLMALIISVIVTFSTGGFRAFKTEIKEINWACITLGIAALLLELGYLLVYRTGWNIGTAAIISTIVVTIALVPIGMILYKEAISVKNIIGIIVSLLGVYLIST